MIFKPELIDRVWKKVNVGKQGYKERLRKEDIETIINTFLKEMSRCMIDAEDINIRGFGKFVSNIRKDRIGYDQYRKKKIHFPERRVIKYYIAKDVDQIIKTEKKKDK